jgi:hypothetical protein
MKGPLPHGRDREVVSERTFRLSANRSIEARGRGYRFYATLKDNPFEPAWIIFDLRPYLVPREFEKIGKRILSDVGNVAVA